MRINIILNQSFLDIIENSYNQSGFEKTEDWSKISVDSDDEISTSAIFSRRDMEIEVTVRCHKNTISIEDNKC